MWIVKKRRNRGSTIGYYILRTTKFNGWKTCKLKIADKLQEEWKEQVNIPSKYDAQRQKLF